MKLLLDQGLPRSAAPKLRIKGIDAIHVSEISYSTATDADILKEALEQDRIVVTLDADFHALLACSGAASPSVIRIRVEGLKSESIVPLLEKIVSDYAEELISGVMITVQPQRLRLRRLPLVDQARPSEVLPGQ